MAKILICGDYAPTKSNEKILSDKNCTLDSIIGKKLADVFLKTDLSVVNVETSLTKSNTPKIKRGQINRSNPTTVEFLKKLDIKVAALANNHVIDNCEIGVSDTLQALVTAGIMPIGIGKGVQEARKPYMFVENGKTIKVLNISNNEFNEQIGEYNVNVLDLFDSFDWIREEKKNCDYMIIVYHGGIEFYQYPTPMLQRICRKMVDCGADFVTCQHSHCIGALEAYHDSIIVYGQGNFLFDDTEHELEQTAVLCEIDTVKRDVEIVPVVKDGVLVRLACDDERKKILDGIKKRSEMVKNGELQKQFADWCNSQEHEIYNTCAGYYVPYKLLNKLSGKKLEKKIYCRKSKMRLYNMLKSIALYEVFEEIMRRYE